MGTADLASLHAAPVVPAPTLGWPPRPDEAALRLQRIETEVTIAAPPEAVFGCATDPSRWTEWHPATLAVVPPAAEPVAGRSAPVGATIVERIRAGGRRFEATWRVLAADAPRLWVIATDTPHGIARIVYRLEEVDDPGGQPQTRFIRVLEVRSAGAGWRSVDPLVARWVLGPQSRRALAALKQLVEHE